MFENCSDTASRWVEWCIFLLPQATLGNEQRSNNSNITYRLSSSTIPPGLIGHFHIGPLTGDITVVHPLDFETIPFGADQPGAIRLTAVAKDHERPYLSSTMDFWITLVVVCLITFFFCELYWQAINHVYSFICSDVVLNPYINNNILFLLTSCSAIKAGFVLWLFLSALMMNSHNSGLLFYLFYCSLFYFLKLEFFPGMCVYGFRLKDVFILLFWLLTSYSKSL